MKSDVRGKFSSLSWPLLMGLVILLQSAGDSAGDHCEGFRNVRRTSGELYSHNGVGRTSHRHNKNCTWQLTAPLGKRIVAWFLFVDLERNYDKVSLFDGPLSSARGKLAEYSHRASRSFISPKFVSTYNVMTVVFLSDGSIAGRGFVLHYETTESSENGTCPGIKLSKDWTSKNGNQIVSHWGYNGSTPYMKNMSCRWQLAPKTRHLLHVRIENLSLGYGDCLNFTGNFIQSPVSVATNCGWKAIRHVDFYAVNGSVEIDFSTNRDIDSTGFLIRVWYDNVCQGIETLTASRGVIEVHSGIGPAEYRSGQRYCQWLIITDRNDRVEVRFVHVRLPRTGSDRITVTDGITHKNLALFTTEHKEVAKNRTYTSKGKSMRIVFYSNNETDNYYGFGLIYRTVKENCQNFKTINIVESGELFGRGDSWKASEREIVACNWQLNAPFGKRISVQFLSLNLETGFENITLYDGRGRDKVIARLGVEAAPKGVSARYESSSNVMEIEYRSQAVWEHGFRLSYEVTTEDSTTSHQPSTVEPNLATTQQTPVKSSSTPRRSTIPSQTVLLPSTTATTEDSASAKVSRTSMALSRSTATAKYTKITIEKVQSITTWLEIYSKAFASSTSPEPITTITKQRWLQHRSTESGSEARNTKDANSGRTAAIVSLAVGVSVALLLVFAAGTAVTFYTKYGRGLVLPSGAEVLEEENCVYYSGEDTVKIKS